MEQSHHAKSDATRGPALMLHRHVDRFSRPLLLALTPGLCLLTYIAFGQTGLLAMAIGLPVMVIFLNGILSMQRNPVHKRDPVTGCAMRDRAVWLLEESTDGPASRDVASLAIGLEEPDRLVSRFGQEAMQTVLLECANRLSRAIREHDIVVRLDGARFGVALTNLRRVDLEMMIEVAARFQRALSEPFFINGAKYFATSSIGFCLPPTAPSLDGEGLMIGAERALDEAMQVTGGAIRRYSEDMRQRDGLHVALTGEAQKALSDGRIHPWFQPQVSTDTGRVTGVEVLARWEDPEIGLISPCQFLPALEAQGLVGHLGDAMLSGALSALVTWDNAGLTVPSIGINVSETELRNPKFFDRVRWELDRHEIAPERLTIEVLESVTADGADDVVARNLWSLSRLGCRIDLDDFGTGNASFASIRRFAVHRLKIDRSYISEVDKDADQQAMVSAIITMAERLDLETLAEGVETVGEHTMVAQLGCLHVQGFAVSRPLPKAAFTAWLEEQEASAEAAILPDLAQSPSKSNGRSKGSGKTA